MNFLAILKDSLRESIDAKVFYVLVGLSVVLVLLGLTTTFTPEPAGKEIMQAAAMPLSIDTGEVDLAQPDFSQILALLLGNPNRRLYEVVAAEPLDGAPDGPKSSFRVLLRLRAMTPGTTTDDAVEARIRERFGRLLDQWQVAEVTDVRRVPADDPEVKAAGASADPCFEVRTRPTPAALRIWPNRFALFFGALPIGREPLPLGAWLFIIEGIIVGGIGAWVAVLVSVVITAFFIPNMLRKGTIDLLLVKPISRPVLLLYKYVGGLLFILVNTTIAISGVWLALGLRSGVWATGILWTILVIAFFFAILYAVSTLFAVLSRSPVVAILMTCAVWFALFLVGAMHGYVQLQTAEQDRARKAQAEGKKPDEVFGPFGRPKRRPPPPAADDERFADTTFGRTVAAIHYILPRTTDLGDLTTYLLLSDLVFANQVGAEKLSPASISWGESLTVSGVFIALTLALACWGFAMRDY